MDRIAKAQQRVMFLEQAVKAEDELVDHVNKVGNTVANATNTLTAVGRSNYYGSMAGTGMGATNGVW